jgi:hypothetical protein
VRFPSFLHAFNACNTVSVRVCLADTKLAQQSGVLPKITTRAPHTALYGDISKTLCVVMTPSQGFLRAFSDNPNAFASGFNRMEKVMKALRVRRLLLFPRFHQTVKDSLETSGPQVRMLSKLHVLMCRVEGARFRGGAEEDAVPALPPNCQGQPGDVQATGACMLAGCVIVWGCGCSNEGAGWKVSRVVSCVV